MRKISKSKATIFYFILAIIIYLFAELIAFVGYWASNGVLFSWSDFQNQRTRVINAGGYRSAPSVAKEEKSDQNRELNLSGTMSEVSHPYLGYVIDSRRDDCSHYGFCDERVIKNKHAPFNEYSKQKYIVAILGGSFAKGVSVQSSPGVLETALQSLPAARDKEVIIHTIALGGYKQPQQLMALNYFLSLGARFDLVINIDGFNEVALPLSENVSKNVFPFFPRNWANRVSGVHDEKMLSLIARYDVYRNNQKELAQTFSSGLLPYSVVGNLIWKYYDGRYIRKQYLTERAYAEYNLPKKTRIPYAASGPPFIAEPLADAYERLAAQWGNSSYQMAILTTAFGFEYFHFLQPNQYLPDSKPMSRQEQEVAVVDWHPYKPGVVDGYPVLIAEGQRLKQRGVNFYDLTMIFKHNEEVLYFDQCCHLNARGYDLVIEAMINAIISTQSD